MAVAERRAEVIWEGNLTQGNGKVTVGSGALGEQPVTWAARTERSDGKTSPEELIAAAHSSCFAMQLSGNIAAAGGTPVAVDVQADVSIGPDPAGGLHLTGVALTVRGEVEGLDEAGFRQAAQDAATGCPVSKALTGVEITVDAALKG